MREEDYTGEAREMDLIEEEHQGDADIARYERSNKEGKDEYAIIESAESKPRVTEEIDHDRTTTNQARD